MVSTSEWTRGQEAALEGYRNELLEDWLGKLLLLRMLTSPEPDEQFIEEVLENRRNYRTETLKSRTALMVLESYDQVGAIVRSPGEGSRQRFVPWSAVIEMVHMGQGS